MASYWYDVFDGTSDCLTAAQRDAWADFTQHDAVETWTLWDTVTKDTEFFKFYEHSIDFKGDRAIYINDDETYIGHGAGDNITSGIENTLVGRNAGVLIEESNGCVCLGYHAGDDITNGDYNTFLGAYSAHNTSSGAYNVAVGFSAIRDNSTENNNTAIGCYAGQQATVANCVYIGYEAGKNNATANALYINNSDSAYPLIYGEFDNDILSFGDNSASFFAHLLQENAGGILYLDETTNAPTPIANYGAIYTKNDNKLYFQDGAGAEHEVAFV